jgi:hypothetical protein
MQTPVGITADMRSFLHFGMDTSAFTQVSGPNQPDAAEIGSGDLDNAVGDILKLVIKRGRHEKGLMEQVDALLPQEHFFVFLLRLLVPRDVCQGDDAAKDVLAPEERPRVQDQIEFLPLPIQGNFHIPQQFSLQNRGEMEQIGIVCSQWKHLGKWPQDRAAVAEPLGRLAGAYDPALLVAHDDGLGNVLQDQLGFGQPGAEVFQVRRNFSS